MNEAAYGKLYLETNDLVGYYEVDLMGTAIEQALLQAIEPVDHVVDFGEVSLVSNARARSCCATLAGKRRPLRAELTAGAELGYVLVDSGVLALGPARGEY